MKRTMAGMICAALLIAGPAAEAEKQRPSADDQLAAFKCGKTFLTVLNAHETNYGIGGHVTIRKASIFEVVMGWQNSAGAIHFKLPSHVRQLVFCRKLHPSIVRCLD